MDEKAQTERNSAYAVLLNKTGIALELIQGGAGFMWVTGNGMDEIVAVGKSDGETRELPKGMFGSLLYEVDDLIVMDRKEIPAFRDIE